MSGDNHQFNHADIKKRSDFYGVEFEWFAADPDGYVAVMCSAGYGPIPDLVFQQLDKQRCIEDQAVKINGYSVNAEWENALLAFSVAGIFVYEWNHWKGPYKRLGIPQMPQRLDELGFLPELRSAFVAIPEPFRNCEELRPELLLPCTD